MQRETPAPAVMMMVMIVMTKAMPINRWGVCSWCSKAVPWMQFACLSP